MWYWAITVLLLPLWFKNSALLARLWPKIWNVPLKSDHLTASALALWPPYDLWGRSLKLHDLILKLNPYQPLFLHYFSKFYTFLWPWLFFWKIHVCRNPPEVLKAASTVLSVTDHYIVTLKLQQVAYWILLSKAQQYPLLSQLRITSYFFRSG